MIDLSDVHSLTDFLRNHKAHVKRLKASGNPQVLTVNGAAELVVQHAGSYQALLDRLDRAEAIAGIRRGLEDAKAGRHRPLAEFDTEMRSKHNISPEQ